MTYALARQKPAVRRIFRVVPTSHICHLEREQFHDGDGKVIATHVRHDWLCKRRLGQVVGALIKGDVPHDKAVDLAAAVLKAIEE